MEGGFLSESDGCADSAEMTWFSFEVRIICVLIHFRIWGQNLLMVPNRKPEGVCPHESRNRNVLCPKGTGTAQQTETYCLSPKH